MIEFIVLALLVAIFIQWPLILWAAATISGVMGLVAQNIMWSLLAIFPGYLAWALYGGIPFF